MHIKGKPPSPIQNHVQDEAAAKIQTEVTAHIFGAVVFSG